MSQATETARDNHGYLCRAPKRSEKAPDMLGRCWIGGVLYEVAGWVSLSKKNRKYLSLKFTPAIK